MNAAEGKLIVNQAKDALQQANPAAAAMDNIDAERGEEEYSMNSSTFESASLTTKASNPYLSFSSNRPLLGNPQGIALE
jgi:hypothetical protein